MRSIPIVLLAALIIPGAALAQTPQILGMQVDRHASRPGQGPTRRYPLTFRILFQHHLRSPFVYFVYFVVKDWLRRRAMSGLDGVSPTELKMRQVAADVRRLKH